MAHVSLRLLAPTDSLVELTDLLHRAYLGLGAMGLNYTAVDQPVETTRRRIAGNECYVAERQGRIVGTVVLQTNQRRRPACARRPDVAYFSQFAVEPDLQRAGIGTRLLAHVEARAARLGFRALALDTAIPATHLVEYYAARGYRRVGEETFPGKTYRSVVMAKVLGTHGDES